MGLYDNAFDASGRFVGPDPNLLYGGIARRPLVQQVAPVDAMPGADTTPPPPAPPLESMLPPADNAFTGGVRRAVGSFVPALQSALGAGQTALGYTDAGRANLQAGQAALQAAEERDPSASLADVQAGRRTVGGYLADKAGALVPDALSLIIPGGAGGKIAQVAARGIGRRAVADLAEQGAAKLAARAGLAEATPAMEATAARAASRVAAPSVAADVQAAERAGQAAGTAAGAYPAAVAGSNQDVLDATTPEEAQTRAQKALAGAAPQAALAAVVPSRFLAKFGGEPAAAAVQKTAEAFLPAVAKAAVKEGAAMAGLNMAQTAAALATHSWMENHLDVLPPGALMQYLDSAATGLLMGSAFGAAGEAVGRRASLAQVAQQRVNDVRAKIDEGVAGLKETARNVVGEAPAETPAAAPTESTPENATVTDSWRAHMDKLAGRADDDAEAQQRLTDIEQAHNAFMESGEPQVGLTRRSNPVELPTALQNNIMGLVPESSPLWLHDDTAKAVAKSAEKLFTGGELDTQDGRHLAALSEAIGPKLVEQMAAHGPEWQRLTDLTQRVKKDSGYDPSQLTAQEHYTQTAQGLEQKLAGMDPSHPDYASTQAALHEAVARAPGSLVDAHEEARAPRLGDEAVSGRETSLSEQEAAPTPTLAQRVVDAAPGSPEHAQAQAALRDALIGHRDIDPTRPYREMRAGEGKNNAIVGNSDAQVQKTLQRGFEVDTNEHNGKPLVVDVQNLVKKKLGGADGERMAGDAFGALNEVMGDLQLAGVKVKPESIRPGVEYAPGAKLTPAQARMLRAGHDTVQAFQARAADNAKAASAEARTPRPARTPEQEAALAKTAAKSTVADRAVDDVQGGEQDNRIDDGRLLERRAPPESPAPDSRAKGEAAKVVQGGGIEDVKHHGPYDKTLSVAREKVATARNKADAAAARHEAGVAIGKAELDKQKAAGQISDPRYARELKALNDYSTGKSREYLTKAARGDFDSFKVIESRAENAEIKENAKAVANEHAESTLPDAETIRKRTNVAESEQSQEQRNAVRRAGLEAKEKAGNLKPFEQAALERARRRDSATARADKDIDTGITAAASPKGPHDHAKETRMANALLDRVGVAGKVKVLPLTDAVRKQYKLGEGAQGLYSAGRENTIYLHSALKGAKRVEVLAHELGHHVIYHELGADFQKASPELRSALMKDYAAWRAEHNDPSKTVASILASRKPLFRARDFETRDSGLKAGESGKLAYLLEDHEYLADQFARALTQHGEAQSIIGKFFAGAAIKLRAAYEALFGAERAKYAPAPSVEKWVQSLFDRNVKDVSGALGYSVPKETADAGVAAAVHLVHGGGEGSPPPRGPGGGATPSGGRGSSVLHEPGYAPFKQFVEGTLTADERGILERALYRQSIMKKINERFGKDEVLQKALENPADEMAALMYVGDKMLRDGSLKLGPKSTDVFLAMRTALYKVFGVAGNNEYALKLFEDIHNGEIKRTRDAGNTYDVRQRGNEATRNEQVQRVFNDAYGIYRDNMYIPWRQYMYGPESNAHLSYTPALRDVFSKFKLATGAIGNDTATNAHGFVQDRMRQLQLFHTQMAKAIDGLDKAQYEKLGDHLREQTAPTDAKLATAHGQVLQLMRDARAYAEKAGLKLNDRGPNYWPVAMDGMQVKSRIGDFRALLDQPHFKAAVDKAGGVDKLVEMAQRTEGNAINERDPLAPPDFRPMNPRVMQFIYDHGTEADKKAFASFQQKDIGGVMGDYLNALTNRAEYTRRAGKDGEKLQVAFKLAEEQGALPKDIARMKDSIAAMTGAYAANGSPLVRAVLGDKAAKAFASSKVKGAIDGMMAYQNVRNLALSTLSALADPMGIGVRYGGIKSADDFHQAFKSFRDGFRAILNTKDTGVLRHMAEIIGIADDHMTSHMLSDTYSPGIGGIARKASDMMFKYNGLNKWVRSTRYMALSAANAFLLKHAAGDGAHSTRYLRELQVEPSDIRRSQDGLVDINTGDAARDERVKRALNRFVDESILRTDASQAPLYYNDPAMRLVTQYQQFAYAFESQILSRIVHEWNYSNAAPIIPLLGYVPVTLAAELAREGIQYGPGGNPNRDNWGWGDYTEMAAERAGLLGPQVQWGLNKAGIGETSRYASMHGLELGPTAQQAEEVGQTLFGQHRLGRTVVDALPVSTLYKHWSP